MKKIILLCLLTLGYIFVEAQETSRWYIINLGDKAVGSYLEKSTKTPQGVSTLVEMKLKMSRLGSELVMESKQNFIESDMGDLNGIESELLFSNQLNRIKAEVDISTVKMTNVIGGKETVSSIAYTGKLIGNEGIRLSTNNFLKKPGDSINYKTFIPDYGIVVEGVRRFLGEEYVEMKGQPVKARKVKDTFKGLPTTRISWLDDDARLLKSTEPNPFGQMTLMLSDEKSALAVADSKVELSEDQYTTTVARSNVRLPQSREIEAITIKIKHKNPDLGFPDFSGSYQKIIEKKKDYVILQIKRPQPGGVPEKLTSEQIKPFVESSSFLNKEDTMVLNTVRKIIGIETDPLKKAMLIRNWVNKNMKFDPGIALAPSSEVIRNMAGTCASFATITTTLCRATSIPSRYLAGYVYADGMWGGHAWTEVYIEDSWIPIDDSMTRPTGVADAARFYFGRSSGTNGVTECFLGGAQLYSNVEIDIIEYIINNKTITPKEQLYTLADDKYENYGLGISINKIAALEFRDLDKVYPENILFKLESNTSNESIKLYQEYLAPRTGFEKIVSWYCRENKIESKPVEISVNGNRAIKATANDRAVLAILNGMDIYVFILESENPERLMKTVFKGFKFTKYPTLNY